MTLTEEGESRGEEGECVLGAGSVPRSPGESSGTPPLHFQVTQETGLGGQGWKASPIFFPLGAKEILGFEETKPHINESFDESISPRPTYSLLPLFQMFTMCWVLYWALGIQWWSKSETVPVLLGITV